MTDQTPDQKIPTPIPVTDTPRMVPRELLEVILDGAIQEGEDTDQQPTTAEVAERMVTALEHTGALLLPSIWTRLAVAEQLTWVFSRSPEPMIQPGLSAEEEALVRNTFNAGRELLARWSALVGQPVVESMREQMAGDRVQRLAEAWRHRQGSLFDRRLVMAEAEPGKDG